MADISLREYIQKIENLIENTEIDQAIAHCKHILKFFPKHIDSYRLLGKAFLEKQKFSDASDIFQRVLSSIPDDFISHIGMSIIREDENNLDASIWHMERAFEVQPSNKAVQDELRRLYTNRDGAAPSKIRLTRGALVRMYVRGELYEQAIGEINAALSEDPNRIDLEVILAKIYFNLGLKVEATETCSKIITKLPYCFEPNKILTEILPGTTREEDQKIFLQRVIDLDPYFEFTNENLKDSLEISDAKIMVDFLDWDPLTDVYDQPDWAKSIGLSVDNQNSIDNDISFWLSDSEKDNSKPEDDEFLTEDSPLVSDNLTDVEAILDDEVTEEIQEQEVIEIEEIEFLKDSDQGSQSDDPQADSKDEIPSDEIKLKSNDDDFPEWLKDAGWEKSTNEDAVIQNEFSIPPLSDETNTDNLETDDLVEVEPGDIPDWIKEIAPSSDLLEENNIGQEDEIEFKNLEDLISDFETEEPTLKTSEELSSWESEFDDETSPASAHDENEIEDEGIKNILSDIQSRLDNDKIGTDEEEEDNLDWLKDISLEEDQTEDLQQLSSSQEFNHDFDKIFDIESDSREQTIDLEDKNSELQNSNFEIEDGMELESEKSDSLPSDEASGSDQEIPDWIKSVVEVDNEEIEVVANEAEENLLGSITISDEQLDEQDDEFTISFDESDIFPEQEDLPTEEPVMDAISEISEYEDELEEKLADQALSQLEDEMITEIEETLSSQNDESISEFSGKTEDEIFSSTDKKEDIETTIAWMEGLAANQTLKSEEDKSMDQEPEKAKDSETEWISEIVDSSEAGLSDLDTTPSWLRDLEIETENTISKLDIPENLIEEDTNSENLTEFVNELEKVSQDDEMQVVQDFTEELTDFDLESIAEETALESVSNLVEDEQELTDELEQNLIDKVGLDLNQESELITDSAEGDTELSTSTDFEEVFEDDHLKFDIEDSEGKTEGENLQEMEAELESVEEYTTTNLDLQSENDKDSDETTIELAPSVDEYSQIEKFVDEQGDESPIVKDPSESINDLEEAKTLLASGEIDQSINIFNSLIKENLFLDDIISDIQSALDHHYPINIDLWKTLGDAYLKNKELQKALDSYSKAEDLLS